MDNYLDIFIGGIIGLVGVVLGFFLQLFSNYLSERKLVKEEFSEIKNAIYSTTKANNLFPEFLKLKRFFVRNPNLLKRQKNNHFFQKWLLESLVEESFTGVGYWDKRKIEEMFKDLDETRL
jgi:CDP-glycerol glycerophosphotransferase (TagB/SpsB family)